MGNDEPSTLALVFASRMGDTNALEVLMNMYKPLVKAKAKQYFLSGGDIEDLVQEGMIGLYKAVLNFDETKGAKFSSFATLCVTRQIQTAIKTANRNKHIPLNSSVMLHTEDFPDSNAIPSHSSNIANPELLVIGQETLQDIDILIQERLTQLEHSVFLMYMDSKTHLEISTVLGIEQKSVDNALQRIKRKIRRSLAAK